MTVLGRSKSVILASKDCNRNLFDLIDLYLWRMALIVPSLVPVITIVIALESVDLGKLHWMMDALKASTSRMLREEEPGSVIIIQAKP